MGNNKIKQIISGVLAIVMTLALTACGGTGSNDPTKTLLENGGTLPLLVQGYSEGNVETQQSSETVWEVLAQIDTYKEKGFRTNFDKAFNINTVTVNLDGVKTNSKQGCIYVVKDENGKEIQSGNSCLRNAFRNKIFNQYWNSENVEQKLSENISTVYADVSPTSGLYKRASLNAYFNLMSFSDQDIYYNASQVITREQFYTLMYKAGHPVTELNYNPEGRYTVNVEGSEYYNKYAEQVADYGWLSVDNGSLNKDNINRVITKLEAIYLVTNYYFSDYVEKVKLEERPTSMGLTNAGDLATAIGAKSEKANKAWQLNTLAYTLNYPDKGLDVNIFKVLLTAELLGITSGLDNVLGPITKDESIQLLINTYLAENKVRDYETTSEYAEMNLWVEPEDPSEAEEVEVETEAEETEETVEVGETETGETEASETEETNTNDTEQDVEIENTDLVNDKEGSSNKE